MCLPIKKGLTGQSVNSIVVGPAGQGQDDVRISSQVRRDSSGIGSRQLDEGAYKAAGAPRGPHRVFFLRPGGAGDVEVGPGYFADKLFEQLGGGDGPRVAR